MMLLSKNAIAEYIMTGGVGAIFCAGYTPKTGAQPVSSRAAHFITRRRSASLRAAGSPLARMLAAW
jgi:hypothetical protein